MAFTYFFRDYKTLEIIGQKLVPLMLGHKYIRIWDAGCAHGPEPFSLAIALSENMGKFIFRNVRILATDIDISNQFGEIIRVGNYPKKEIQRIPDMIFENYFKPCNQSDHFMICSEIKKRVEYLRHDLLTLKPPNTGFNLIMCKNVLLHFSETKRIQVLEMFHNNLHTGGFLVMERTQALPKKIAHLFKKIEADAQIYQKIVSATEVAV
ncbi:chemotaxis protein CheR [bacterium]|nr:chemotaxis protein CheR [bacterium]